jgi:hypothetical protein
LPSGIPSTASAAPGAKRRPSIFAAGSGRDTAPAGSAPPRPPPNRRRPPPAATPTPPTNRSGTGGSRRAW